MNRLFLFAVLLCFPLHAAKADYFVWQDSESGLTMSFPDTWKEQNNRNPDDVLSISAPSAGDDPTCQIKVSEDRRYMIFPPDFGDAVQREAVSIPFWKVYYSPYDDYTIDRVFDGAGLGRWRASYALGSYSRRNGTALEQRRAIMFASLYHDKMYIVECSALNHGYDKWDADFKSVIKSIDFKKMYHERAIGDYHDFLKKVDLYFWAQTGPEGTVSY